MKGFITISRAATDASGVILESWPARSVPESVVAKRRDSVTLRAAKPYGMTSAWGGRTVHTSILSSPRNLVGDLLLRNRTATINNRFPNPAGRPTLGNDIVMKKGGHPEFISGSTAWVVSSGFTLIELLVVILIIGILAAAAMPSYRVAVGSSRAATMYNLVRAVDLAQQHFYMQTNRYAANLDSLIIAMPAGFKKENPSKISSTDVSCNISGRGGTETAFLCEDIKDLVLIEKYHRDTFFICWADMDSQISNKICQNLSGQDTPTSQGDGGGAWAHRQAYLMNK